MNTLVWTIMAVVLPILFENAMKMVFIQDQDRIQTLLAN